MPTGSRYPGKLGLAVPPMSDPIAQPRRANIPEGKPDPLEGMISKPWIDFFTTITNQITATAYGLQVVFNPGNLNSSVATTDMGAGVVLNDGIYRLTYMMRIHNAAGVSSSVEVDFSWTDHGSAQSYAGPAMVSNTTTEWQSETFLIFSDGGTPVNYSTTYASNAAGQMFYSLYIFLDLMFA